MHYEFCTLFDKNYLTRGLSLYNSLLKHCPDFKLWILCMDDNCFQMLKKLELEKAELIQLKNFEDPELLKAKCNRSHGEYCWTCTPSICLYVLRNNKKLKTITYLDSDLFFYSSPLPIYEEFNNNSIMIIPHRLPSFKKKKEEEAGKFNVGMLIFRNNTNGLNCLNWWRRKCNEWCFNYVENNKYGDQKYLDEFPKKFPDVHILQHIGANVAPWNIRNYKITKKNKETYIDNSILIFYHFYQFKIHPRSHWLLPCPSDSHYITKNSQYNYIYKQYIKSMYGAIKKVKKINNNFPLGTLQRQSLITGLKEANLYKLKNIIKKIINYPGESNNRNMKIAIFFKKFKTLYNIKSKLQFKNFSNQLITKFFNANNSEEEKIFQKNYLFFKKNYLKQKNNLKKLSSTFLLRDWAEFEKKIEKYFLNNLAINFLSHPMIKNTMFIKPKWHKLQLNYLEKKYSSKKLKNYLCENKIGHPLICNLKYKTSANSVHHLNHLSLFEDKTKYNLKNIKNIVEWGGGYGNMAKILLRIKPKITYNIIDLPIFIFIQAIYLSCIIGRDKINIVTEKNPIIKNNLINLIPLNKKILNNIDFHKPDIFISTWALSESNDFSQNLVERLDYFNSKNLLIAHQTTSSSMPYASNIVNKINKFDILYHKKINYINGENYYLFAKFKK